MFKYFKDFSKFFYKKNTEKQKKKKVNLFLNNRLITGSKATYYKNHYRLYRNLRNMIINEEELILCTSNVRGFNTKFTIINFDVIVCDRFGKVIANFKDLNNDYISEYSPNYWYLFFLPVGFINFWNVKNGDTIKIKKKYY